MGPTCIVEVVEVSRRPSRDRAANGSNPVVRCLRPDLLIASFRNATHNAMIPASGNDEEYRCSRLRLSQARPTSKDKF